MPGKTNPIHFHFLQRTDCQQRPTAASVVGVDMIINQLSTWLQDAWKNDQGLALIVEANGDLVASSSPELTLVENGKKIRRANISELDHHLANHLHTQYFQSQSKTEESPSGSTLPPSTQPGLFKVENEHYLTQATPWGENYGLDWYLITAVRADQGGAAQPASNSLFMHQHHSHSDRSSDQPPTNSRPVDTFDGAHISQFEHQASNQEGEVVPTAPPPCLQLQPWPLQHPGSA